MTQLAATKLRDDFSEVVNRVAFGGERVMLMRHGKGLLALVPLDDAEFLEELEDKIDIESARAALAEARSEGLTEWDDVKQHLGL